MRRLGVSRRHLFQTVEAPVLAGLPGDDYEFAEWRLMRVATDYHVEFESFFYSVPHRLIREQVDLRATTRTNEIIHRGQRIAAHQRRYGGRRHGTYPDHMPSPNTVHLRILIAFPMSIDGRRLSVRHRSGKLLIFLLTPRLLRR
jgi:hypothetical protein